LTLVPLNTAEQIGQYRDWQDQHWHIVYTPALSLDWLQALLDFDHSLLNKDDESVLKLSKQKLILHRQSDTGELAASLYRNFSTKKVLYHSMKQSPGYQSWKYAHYLLNHGFLITEPLAYMELRKMGLCKQSWYICRFNEGGSCDDYFVHSHTFTPSMINTAFAIVKLFIQLRECQLSHGNFKATNIRIIENKPSLINFDSMKYHKQKATAEKYWRLDIEQFMDNWRERYDIYKQFKQAFSKHGINV